MTIDPSLAARPGAADLHQENRTLHEVIRLVSSSVELAPMLHGVVQLATEATHCHACFIYLRDGEELIVRAASEVFAQAVGTVRFSMQEGLAGWVARTGRPQFVREGAMDDPRMKYIPMLREEHFQSMAAVPIPARAGDTIGVIVLHTEAPHEFGDEVPVLLAQIASLVAGAIENAQLYDRERRRADALGVLAELAQRVAGASGIHELARELVDGVSTLLGAETCQLFGMSGESDALELLASVPRDLPAPRAASAAELTLASIGGMSGHGDSPWPSVATTDVLAIPLEAGRRVGLLCAGATGPDGFDRQASEIARAVGHLAAVAIERAELIADLTQANAVKDLFEALAAGDDEFAATKAVELRCDLSEPYVMLHAEPSEDRDGRGGSWPTAAAELARALSALAPRAAIEAGPGPVRALVCVNAQQATSTVEMHRQCEELGRTAGAVIGIGEPRRGPEHAVAAYREARDAATIGGALRRAGGAIPYSGVGAYRYLVQIPVDAAPQDRMRVVVDELIAYDRRRRTVLLDTLERYLTDHRSVIGAARALHIHPNTMRQRLDRIAELTGLDLESDDLLSLELAIKLARLHSRHEPPARSERRPELLRGID